MNELIISETIHILPDVSDYVLDLLPGEKRRSIETHAATCVICRNALQQELQLVQEVKSTLFNAARPKPSQLVSLMPDFPSRRFSLSKALWQKQFAPIALLFIFILGGWGLWQNAKSSIWVDPSPTTLQVTATMTDIPTSTTTQTKTVGKIFPLNSRATTTPLQPEAGVTPVPNPAPIAMLNQ